MAEGAPGEFSGCILYACLRGDRRRVDLAGTASYASHVLPQPASCNSRLEHQNTMQAFDNPVADVESTSGSNDSAQRSAAATPADSLSTDDDREVAEFVLEGTALGCLSEENPLRIILFNVATHVVTELAMLSLIMINVLILIFQSPANTLGEGFNHAADTVDFLCTVVFTLECILKILAFGLYWESDYAYLRGNWHILDFGVVTCGWVYILFLEDSGASGAATGRGIKPNVFRCVRALRPLRALKFFAGLKAVLNALGNAWYLILEVVGFLCFFFAVLSAMGISLFKGALTYRCEDFYLTEYAGYDEDLLIHMLTHDSIMQSYFTNMSLAPANVKYHACPESIQRTCMLCGGDSVWEEFIVNGKANYLANDRMAELLSSPNMYADKCCRVFTSETTSSSGEFLPFDDPASAERYDDRVNDVDLYGFDNLFAAVLTEFVATTMDEWPALSH
eukprot:COSAG02_NODE_7925_length_2784_cov_1.614525_2_plen_450_part_01